jgi:serine/threonine-protein kinase
MEPEKLGPFRIGRVLGRGGMGTVYEGTCDADGSIVAVKVLADSLNDDAEVRLRFETEIETLKRLYHPNIVRLSGFGTEQGQLYYTMEFVNGSSLQQELRKRRLFQWQEVAKIGLEICHALRHAHDRGVIHRDIKPANILMNQQGIVKLSDFGIARFFGSRQITDAHSVLGTLEYMSPEQALAQPISTSSDLYSLGGVLYALFVSKPPFPARSLPELLRRHQDTAPVPIRSVRFDVPDELAHIIGDLLQIRPEDRPRNALLVAKRLQSLLQTTHVLKTNDEQTGRVEDGSAIIDLGRVEKSESLSDSFKRIGEETVTAAELLQGEVPDGKTQTQHPTKDEPPSADSVNVQDSSLKLSDSHTRFTAVTDRSVYPFEDEHRVTFPIFSLPTVLASIMLIIVGLVVYYLLQDVPPEKLYDRITAAIEKGESEDGYPPPALLRSAKKDIDTFLMKYPDHPSAEQVRFYQDELNLSEHERRLERRINRALSPVERIYVEILASSPHDPEQRIDKLRAFIAVFQTDKPTSEAAEDAKPRRSTSGPVEICVELARRRLKKLEQEVDGITAEQEQVVRRRLNEATDLDSIDPLRAEAIRQGIIELYQHHRWAKQLIEEAKQKLNPKEE